MLQIHWIPLVCFLGLMLLLFAVLLWELTRSREQMNDYRVQYQDMCEKFALSEGNLIGVKKDADNYRKQLEKAQQELSEYRQWRDLFCRWMDDIKEKENARQ